MHQTLHLLGFASGLGGAQIGSVDGPAVMQKSPFLAALTDKGLCIKWNEIVYSAKSNQQSKDELIAVSCQKLANHTFQFINNKEFFAVIGGEHTSAVGTWSGVSHALKKKGDLGLIWIDAHLDSHTPETTLTGNIHGMPVACLLGYGFPSLTRIMNNAPKIKPEHLCLIGIRSFERGERELIEKLNIRVYFIEEVIERGLEVVMKEALAIVTKGTVGFGLSLDLDGIDPEDAPGTGTPEKNGIKAKELRQSLQLIANDPHFVGFEIVEFDPHLDENQKTEQLVAQLIEILTLGF